MLLHPPRQARDVVRPRRQEMQRPAPKQGRIEVLLGQIETQRADQQHPVRVPDFKLAEKPMEQVGKAPVINPRRLGLPGGARREDHVNQILRRCDAPEIRTALPGQRRRIGIHPHHGHSVDTRRQAGVVGGDQHAEPGRLHHVSQPLPGIRRIQRHIRPARLEHSVDCDHCVQRPIQAHPHQGSPTHPERLQMPRQLVGLVVERPVGQPLPAHLHRYSFRRAPHLLFKELMDTPVSWVFEHGTAQHRSRRPRSRTV